MHLADLTDEYAAAYERFLAGRDDALLYYSLRFRDFLTRLLDCEPTYRVACTADGEVAGVLPMMRRNGPFGVVYNSLPFYGSNGGILAEDSEAFALLAGEYNRLVRAEGVAAGTWVGNPLGKCAPDGSIACDVTDERIGQVSDLGPWAALRPDELAPPTVEPSARRNVKKAAAAGVTVRVANDAIPFLEDCHRENMAAMGGRAKGPEFFSLLPQCFAPDTDYTLYVAEHEGAPVAALLLLYFARTVEYYTPVTRHDARSLQPMALILATAMRDAATRGFTRWNWGGTWMTQSGVYRFKKKWGAVDYPYTNLIAVNEPRLYECSPAALREAYGDFYVIPFRLAAGREGGAAR